MRKGLMYLALTIVGLIFIVGMNILVLNFVAVIDEINPLVLICLAIALLLGLNYLRRHVR